MYKKTVLFFFILTSIIGAMIGPHIIFSNRLGIFFASLSKNATEKLKTDLNDEKETLLLYTINVVNGLDPHDAWIQWKFLSGGGACNHLSDMYLLLLENLDFAGFSFGVKWMDDVSRHTIPLVQGSKGERFLYDPYYQTSVRGENEKLLSMKTICSLDYDEYLKQPQTTRDYFDKVFRPMTKEKWSTEKGLSMFCERIELRGENVPFSQRSTLSRFTIRGFTSLPIFLQKTIFKYAGFLEVLNKRLQYTFNKDTVLVPADSFHGEVSLAELWWYLSARIEHLFINIESANKYYNKIITSSKNKSLIDFSKDFILKLDNLEKYTY